jgi:hypothetical protein
LKSKEYFKFVVSKIESDLKIYSASGELLKCVYMLSVLKNSNDLLKDIYTISRIKNLKSLGNYLLFILKKTETGEVCFDNLLENLILDKDFILTELLNRFDINSVSEKTVEVKQKPEEFKEDEITGEIRRILAESRFKVEEIDNELVTEEFIESEVKEDNDLIVRGNYLELLQPESGLEEESVFSLPTNKPKPESEDLEDFFENDVFSLPGEKNREETVSGETSKEDVNTEELEEIKLNEDINVEKENKQEPAEEIPEEIIGANIAGEVSDEEQIEELIPETEDIEIPLEQIQIESGEEEEKQEEKQEETHEETHEEKQEETHEEEDKEEIKKEVPEIVEEEKHEEAAAVIEECSEEIPEESESVEVENSVYMQYESELFSRDEWLGACFDEMKSLNREDENFEERREELIKEITENSAYMEAYSQKMSFEVITSIYNVMNMTFSSYGKTVGNEILALFKNAISLVESLIKGEDYAGFDNVIKSLEMLKNTLIDSRKEEISVDEKEEKEADELETYMSAKQYDTNDRQKLSQLKQNILDVENVFKSLDDIKGKYQAYEALRRLSHTFEHLKELVGIANALEMRKLSQLAEASYIFIKFIQNYRMNPFESEISEVFKYIIYNFKLIFLDKPTKDIDLLISYLNDPVKIFEKKNRK